MSADYIEPYSSTIGRSIAGDIYLEVKKWFKALDPKGTKFKDYHEGLSNVFGLIQIMGMSSPRKLENIYVGIKASNFLKKLSRHSPELNVEAVKRVTAAQGIMNFRANSSINRFLEDLGLDICDDYAEFPDIVETAKQGRPFETQVGLSRVEQVIAFINDNHRMFILGHPGSGKTTLLKYLTLVFSGHIKLAFPVEPMLPLYVPLREFKRGGQAQPTSDWLRDLVLSCASEISTKPFSKEWLEEALEKGQCLILLDGVDEVPAEQIAGLFHSIRAFSTKFRTNKIIVTCRVASFDSAIEGFKVYEIDDFIKEDKILFVNQWFDANTTEAKRLIADLEESRLANDLCRTPLLLTMICVLYEYRRSIPGNRAELYEACLDALLFRWDTYRSVDRPSLLPREFGPERKKLLLSRVAQKSFRNEIIYFKHNVLCELIQAELNFMDIENASAEAFIRELESNNGLLIEYSPNVFCFSHLTFHEFFVSLYYCDTKEEAKLFNYAISDPRYLEIFLMYLEKSYNCDKIIMQLISHIDNSCFRTRDYDEYIHRMVREILRCFIAVNRKLALALRECELRLECLNVERLEDDDQPILFDE